MAQSVDPLPLTLVKLPEPWDGATHLAPCLAGKGVGWGDGGDGGSASPFPFALLFPAPPPHLVFSFFLDYSLSQIKNNIFLKR